jgi:hypothetical protein
VTELGSSWARESGLDVVVTPPARFAWRRPVAAAAA